MGRRSGENEKGWNKTHAKSLRPYGTEEARGTSWQEIYGPAVQPVLGFQTVTASYLFGQQGEGAHVGTWRAS